jgi:hypothetical protein
MTGREPIGLHAALAWGRERLLFTGDNFSRTDVEAA